MTTPEPGERRPAALDRPPSARYAGTGGADGPEGEVPGGRGSRGAIARAVLIAALTAGALALVGGVLASTAGLLFIAGIGSAGTGLVLAGAPLPRPAVVRWAVALGVGAVIVGAVATWLVSRAQGGVLGPLDLLWQTFGPLPLAEVAVAALAAAWGGSNGPVRWDR